MRTIARQGKLGRLIDVSIFTEVCPIDARTIRSGACYRTVVLPQLELLCFDKEVFCI